MYNLQKLIGSVITIKSIWGNEYVAVLSGFNQDGTSIMVSNPQTVVTENDDVMLVPFTVTGSDSDAVMLLMNTVFAVVPAKEDVAANFLKIMTDK